MLVIVIALMALERYGRRHRRFSVSLRRAALPSRAFRCKAGAAYVSLAVCLIPVALGFLFPLVFLAYEVLQRGLLIGFDHDLIRHTLTTVTLAATATAIAITLGLAAALAVRLIRGKFASTCLTICRNGLRDSRHRPCARPALAARWQPTTSSTRCPNFSAGRISA